MDQDPPPPAGRRGGGRAVAVAVAAGVVAEIGEGNTGRRERAADVKAHPVGELDHNTGGDGECCSRSNRHITAYIIGTAGQWP